MTTDRDRVNAALDAWFGEGDWRSRNVRYRELMSQALAAADTFVPPADTGDEAATAMKRLEQVLDDERIAAHGLEAEVERLTRERDEMREQAHYANGVADLAMKHRDHAEARLARAREALEAVDAEVILTGALKDIVDRALANSEPAGQEPKP
jgi:hypothetical protein